MNADAGACNIATQHTQQNNAQEDSGAGNDALSALAIRHALQELQPAADPLALHTVLQVVPETGSTNADLMRDLEHLHHPTLLLAESQLAGRGRGGRTWYSQAAHSLTFSLAWKFAQPIHTLLGLPLAVGVALAEALGGLGMPVQLKWPNDVLKDGKKLAGILIESGSTDHGNWAVIGIGLNLRVEDGLEQKIGRPVADARWLAQMGRNQLMAHLLQHLALAMQEFAAHGLPAFQQRWNQLHAYAGEAVVILDHGQLLQQGRACGIDGQGRLLLDCDGEQIAVLAGDVSLRSSAEWAAGLSTAPGPG